ncbi:GNAT family N-acetyltransferase [Methylobacterium radiodurans]|uniref:Cellulose biosynthesis protein CelD n=1 Tax=Methylobacterium radiodurans TaxID=2202828 RepID=A0A2U8VXN2_9HYPH|nr:GNAT family N-acetyltransferase [Methylobacterium radiodurans]AWN38238.1 cellulose biosynthesis protein CelD [Methylobacterium radiodurans]
MGAGSTRSDVALVPLAGLDAAAWDDLFARARAPHPHYSRHVLAAHRAAGLAAADLSVLTVHRGRRLDALLPIRSRRDITGLGRSVAVPFRSAFVTATGPLVAADAPDALDALVRGLAAAAPGRAWRWPLLPQACADPLRAALDRAGWSHGAVAEFARPVLDRRESHADFLAAHPRSGRLKDLRRRARRLAGDGLLRLETATAGSELAAAVEAFLDLERRGWKGAAGTAMACRPETARLARALFADADGPVRARADSLTLDGVPVAISLALTDGRTATLLKTAYDEGRRAQAPGLVLEAEIVRAFHETRFADRLDSAALPGSALEDLYPERESVIEILALPTGARGPSLAGRIRLARAEHRARAAAKRMLGRR